MTPSIMTDDQSHSNAQPPNPASSNDTHTRHKNYYLADGVIFLVERTLFKVPRDKLTLSDDSIFTALFRLPPGKDSEGMSDARPIKLGGVTCEEFERLLSFLYPLTLDYETFTQSWSAEDWIQILHLSYKWGMSTVNDAVISQLSRHFQSANNSEATQINLGVTFQYIPWIKAGYMKLVRRPAALTLEEAQLLGMNDLVCFYAAREDILRRVDLSYWNQPRALEQMQRILIHHFSEGTSTTSIVKEAFRGPPS